MSEKQVFDIWILLQISQIQQNATYVGDICNFNKMLSSERNSRYPKLE